LCIHIWLTIRSDCRSKFSNEKAGTKSNPCSRYTLFIAYRRRAYVLTSQAITTAI